MHAKFTFLIFTVTLFSCKELYNDYQSEVTEEYLVVEGMITDDPGPYSVTISKAIAYSNDLDISIYKPEPETKATVKIRSDKGEDIVLYELDSEPGTYASQKEELTGEVGHRYWLYVQTQSGDVYESVPSVLMDKPDIPNLYAVAAEKTVLDETFPGGSQFVTKPGIQLSCDIANNNAADYIKIDMRTFTPRFYVVDSTFIQGGDEPFSYEKMSTFYCWLLRSADPVPNIIGAGNKTSTPLLSGIPIGFINQNNPYSAQDTVFYELPEWYVISDNNTEINNGMLMEIVIEIIYSNYYIADIMAYAVNDTIYEYYRNLKNQVTANNKIFDPIPVQLTGNIRCTSDPGKSIFGVFTTASVMRRQFFIRWSGKFSTPVVEKQNEYFPVQSSDCTTEPPVFWRNY
jgi:hypothetical protein